MIANLADGFERGVIKAEELAKVIMEWTGK